MHVADMMREVIDNGTGRRIRTTFGIGEDMAGKTGTTQGSADGWFIAMHPEIVAGAWVGFSDPRVTFRTSYWGQGGNNALLIVGDFYRRAFRHPETRLVGMRFPEPPEFDERTSFGDRITGFVSDAASAVGNAFADAFHWIRDRLSGGDDDFIPEPEHERESPRTTPAAEEPDRDRYQAIADSLNRAQRDSLRLYELIEQMDRATSQPEPDSPAPSPGPPPDRGPPPGTGPPPDRGPPPGAGPPNSR